MRMNSKKPMSPFKMYILLITYAVVLTVVLIQRNEILGWIGKFLGFLKPFFIGLIAAYILNIPMRTIENRILPWCAKKLKVKKHSPTRARGIAVAVTMVFVAALLTAIFSVLLPQLVNSIVTFAGNFNSYVASLESMTNRLAERLHLQDELWSQIETISTGLLSNIQNWLQNSVPVILNASRDIIQGIADTLLTTILSTVIAIHMLYHKEKLLKNLRRIIDLFLPQRVTGFLYDTGKLANETFSGFVGGELTETCIVSILCFIGTSIMRVPYALLISVTIGVTNLVPIFGPWVGAIICSLILLMIDPGKVLLFAIFIVVLQQLEGHVLYPRVVGSSVGLSALWVLFVLVVCRGLFGIMGIFIGIPLCAVLIKLADDYLKGREARRNPQAEPAEEPISAEAVVAEAVVAETEARAADEASAEPSERRTALKNRMGKIGGIKPFSFGGGTRSSRR